MNPLVSPKGAPGQVSFLNNLCHSFSLPYGLLTRHAMHKLLTKWVKFYEFWLIWQIAVDKFVIFGWICWFMSFPVAFKRIKCQDHRPCCGRNDLIGGLSERNVKQFETPEIPGFCFRWWLIFCMNMSKNHQLWFMFCFRLPSLIFCSVWLYPVYPITRSTRHRQDGLGQFVQGDGRVLQCHCADFFSLGLGPICGKRWRCNR